MNKRKYSFKMNIMEEIIENYKTWRNFGERYQNLHNWSLFSTVNKGLQDIYTGGSSSSNR